jgi:hypothetical protein
MTSQVVDAHEEWYGPMGMKLALTKTYGWVGGNGDLGDALRRACREANAENPNVRFYGYRREVVLDGAGAQHVNVAVYFTETQGDGTGEPKVQLDPRNLNEAPTVVFGQVLSAEDMRQLNIGAAEADIKRTPLNQ